MKNLIILLALGIFLAGMSANAQEVTPKQTTKKECCKADKKTVSKDKKACSTEEKKACDKTKKESCCASKKAEPKA